MKLLNSRPWEIRIHLRISANTCPHFPTKLICEIATRRGWYSESTIKSRQIVDSPYRREHERLQSLKKQVADGTSPSLTFREIYELDNDAGHRLGRLVAETNAGLAERILEKLRETRHLWRICGRELQKGKGDIANGSLVARTAPANPLASSRTSSVERTVQLKSALDELRKKLRRLQGQSPLKLAKRWV
jgi:hypothetical protein